MWLAVVAILIGLAILVWSADVFIEGATALAKKARRTKFFDWSVDFRFGHIST